MPETILVPWLHDRHSHTSLYASLLGCTTIAGMNAKDSLAAMGSLDPDHLSLVSGWHSALAPLSREELDALPPVIIVNRSMHGYALSEAAIPLLADIQPELARYRNDPGWSERNLPQLLEFYGRTARLTPEKLITFMECAERLGLAGVDDMLLPGEEAFQVIQQSPWASSIRCWATPEVFQSLSPGSREALGGLKFFTDGALGSRTAALRGTYSDGSEGLLLYQDEELLGVLGECHRFRKPLAIHAIGDRAIEQVLGTLERLKDDGVSFPLVRLEHVQFMDEPQARRAKAMGLVLSMQPNFSSDSRDYADRLSPRWLENNNPFRMLIDGAGFVPGRDLIFGSDGMPHGIEYALQWSLFPDFPGQRLSLEELMEGYGIHPGRRGYSRLEIDPDLRRVRLLESGRAG